MKMFSVVKGPAIWILEALDLYSLYSLRKTGPLFEDGWFRSYREQAAVDAAGAPLPWITYPAIEFIRRRIKPEMSVFEFGSGGSTLWWAKQVCEVTSVEHDRSWFETMRKHVVPNLTAYQIDLVYGGAYAAKILEFENRFDIVVVDGRDRVNCLKNSLGALKASGVIILDNSNLLEYSDGVTFLHEKGFRHIEFVGYAPITNHRTETAIFYRNENVFGI